MKITANHDFSSLKDIEDVRRFVGALSDQIVDAINGGLTIKDNFFANKVTYYFTSANTSYQITHGLGTVPTGYMTIGQSKAGSVYDGSSLILGPTFANLQFSTSGATVAILFIK